MQRMKGWGRDKAQHKGMNNRGEKYQHTRKERKNIKLCKKKLKKTHKLLTQKRTGQQVSISRATLYSHAEDSCRWLVNE